MNEKSIPFGIKKFLFCIDLNNYGITSKCFSIVNLKLANQIMSIFGLFGSFTGIYLGIISNVLALTFIYCALDIISLICCVMIFISTLNKDFYLAYWGHVISSAKTIMYFGVYFCYFFILRIYFGIKYFEENPVESDQLLFSKFLEALIKVPISIYFLYISYSYTMHLRLGNWDLIEGKKYSSDSSLINNIK